MKLRLQAFSVCLILSAAVYAQLPNGGMEDWTTYVGAFSSVDHPEGWETPDMIGADVGADAVVVTEETVNIHGGSSAARLETKTVNVVSFGLTFDVPGTITTGSISFDFVTFTPTVSGGAVIASAYDNFRGFYAYAPAGTDTMNVTVLMFKGEDTVGYGNFRSDLNTGGYVEFNCPITYFSPDIPDKIQATIASSGGFTSLTPGSVLFVDDLELTGGVGTEDWTNLDIAHNVYPNPASDYININNPTKNNVVMEVYNLQGQKMDEVLMNPEMNSIDLTNYAGGIYTFRLMDNGAQIYAGKFKVAK